MADHDQEDAATIADAIRDRKIDASYAHVWAKSLREDREGTKRVIAAIATPPAGKPRPMPAAHNDVHRIMDDLTPWTTTGSATQEQMNAVANADPELQNLLWKIGVRDGIEPPPEQYLSSPLRFDD